MVPVALEWGVMGSAIGLRDDFDGPALRRLARVSKAANQTRRLLALAGIYDGGSRTEAARIGGVGLQIVRDWVIRFNTSGPDGLLDGKAPGPRSRQSMGWCAGGWSIWFGGSMTGLRSRSTRPPSAAS